VATVACVHTLQRLPPTRSSAESAGDDVAYDGLGRAPVWHLARVGLSRRRRLLSNPQPSAQAAHAYGAEVVSRARERTTGYVASVIEGAL
jgi:hypothetical protein